MASGRAPPQLTPAASELTLKPSCHHTKAIHSTGHREVLESCDIVTSSDNDSSDSSSSTDPLLSSLHTSVDLNTLSLFESRHSCGSNHRGASNERSRRYANQPPKICQQPYRVPDSESRSSKEYDERYHYGSSPLPGFAIQNRTFRPTDHHGNQSDPLRRRDARYHSRSAWFHPPSDSRTSKSNTASSPPSTSTRLEEPNRRCPGDREEKAQMDEQSPDICFSSKDRVIHPGSNSKSHDIDGRLDVRKSEPSVESIQGMKRPSPPLSYQNPDALPSSLGLEPGEYSTRSRPQSRSSGIETQSKGPGSKQSLKPFQRLGNPPIISTFSSQLCEIREGHTLGSSVPVSRQQMETRDFYNGGGVPLSPVQVDSAVIEDITTPDSSLSKTSITNLTTLQRSDLSDRDQENAFATDETYLPKLFAKHQMLVKLSREVQALLDSRQIAHLKTRPQGPYQADASQSNVRGHATTNDSSRKSGKRPWRATNPAPSDGEDENDDHDDRSQKKPSAKNYKIREQEKPYACPFHKYNPLKYCATSSRYHSCAGPGFLAMHRLK